jgi:hypothetical protein
MIEHAWYFHAFFVLNRWFHIVGMTLLVGGILFFEFVLPLATEDLQDEQRLAVFGRARWVFRKVIWVSVLFIVFSGLFAAWRLWPMYGDLEHLDNVRSIWVGPKPWFIAHAAMGLVGMFMALRLVFGRSPMERPVQWVRATLIVLIATIMLAAVTRYIHLHLHEVDLFHHDIRALHHETM